MNIYKILCAIEELYYTSEEGKFPIPCQLVETNGKHNCFACNISQSVNCLSTLAKHLDDKVCDDQKYQLFLPQIYIIVEELDELLKEAGLKKKKEQGTYPFISRLKYLMSFLKHPKSKIFFRHARYFYVSNSKDCPTYSSDEEDVLNFFLNNTKSNSGVEEECMDELFLLNEIIDYNEIYGIELSKAQRKLLNEFNSIYLCESDLKKYYGAGSERKNKNREYIELLATFEELPIFLPKISDLVLELKNLLESLFIREDLFINGKLSKYSVKYIG